jgi:hypothetical protein
MQFLNIKDHEAIFDIIHADARGDALPKLTEAGISEFQQRFPTISLLEEDVALKWIEADLGRGVPGERHK